MDKEIILIDIHSFVDVITNSSTEIYIFDTKKTLETFKEILYRIMEDCSWYNVEADGNNYLYNIKQIKSIIDKSYIYTKEMFEEDKKLMWRDSRCSQENIGRIIMDDANELPSLMKDIIDDIFICQTHRI